MFIYCPDPEHQRAKGNLKYFEFQLEKQKKAEQDEPPKETKEEEEDTAKEQKKKSRKKRESFTLVPERKKYEMLCRGEGIKMVRQVVSCRRWCLCEVKLVMWTCGSPLILPDPPQSQPALLPLP